MSGTIEEHVLCSAAASLPRIWLPETGAIRLSEEELLAALASMQPAWLLRSAAESNPEFKQWIPYVLLRNERGELAAYPRGGGEKRLHGLWSLGIGGHINSKDAESTPMGSEGWGQTLWNGLRRELAEEYPGAACGETQFIGLIHESQTAVGRVHIGAAFLHQVSGASFEFGNELAGLHWLPRAEIGAGEWPLERFELWSRLALDLLP
jgi:predicted NUDIX family phosphoesterase